MTNQSLLTTIILCTSICLAAESDTDQDGIPDVVEQKLGSPIDVKQELTLVATSADGKYPVKEAILHAPDIVRFEAGHVGDQRLLFKVVFARPPVFAGAGFIIYADLDNDPRTGRVDRYHGGVDVMVSVGGDNVGLSLRNPNYHAGNTIACGTIHGSAFYVSLDAPLHVVDGQVEIGLHLLSQRQGGRSDGTKHTVAHLPHFADRAAPKLPKRRSTSLRNLSDYRYHNGKVKLEKRSDKGLTYERVAPKKPIEFGRPRPPVPFSGARRPGKPGTIEREQIAVHLLEEGGVARGRSPVTFGLPLPQGGLFDLASLRVLDQRGDEVPAQFTAMAFWPDDSLKWVLVDHTTAIEADGKAGYTVELGRAVQRKPARSRLAVTEDEDSITVVTGPLKALIDKTQFNVFREVWLDKNRDRRFSGTEIVAASDADGVRLIDEHGKRFTMSQRKPDSVTVEQVGPRKVVVRIAGQYADETGKTYMSYITRLTFRERSARVTVAHTHVNSYVKTEFTDLTSLTMAMQPVGGDLRDEDLFDLFQIDDSKCVLRVGSETIERKRYRGGSWFKSPAGWLGVTVHEFWQRWPKRLRATEDEFAIDLLPEQPSPDYGKDFPHWLKYPFVDGKYRFKWGMAFTTRVTFDFAGTTPPPERVADADTPLIAVLPASWYAETKALDDMAAPMGKQFAQWDKYVADGYKGHMMSKKQSREYGYFNYGDWYGERGRNWGNNEYDLAHGFFMQFARIGNRDYFRLALAAARHQADVDCVHAYPDPAYIGANHQHSIGHTGTWSQRPTHATWTHRYDSHTDARNGHTWADGMMDAWYLTGDARVMEASLGLGEHIAWAMSRTFSRLGTHERSAGWSLAAIMAIYRGTYDPVYLEAAKRIAAVPLREQKLDDGGAWPHVLPRDHSGGHYGARGNNLFLIGVLLAGLKDYHEQTGDPAVAKSLIAGARWIMKSWDEDAEGWPYSATTEGRPLYTKVGHGLNNLIAEPLAYVGKLTGEERFLEVAGAAFAAVARSGAPSFGKSVAQKMHFVPGLMGLLQEWYRASRKDKGESVLDGSGAGMERFIAKTRDAKRHSVRAPNEKVFYVKLRGTTGELVATRQPHGAMRKDWELGTIQVTSLDGEVVKEGKFSTDGEHEFRAALKASKPGAVYKVLVKDDQRGVWGLSGDNLQIVMQTVPGFRIGGVGRARFHFFVPANTTDFSIKLLGVHRGPYGGAVVSPTGKLIALHQAINSGLTHIKGAPQLPGADAIRHSADGLIKVKPDAADTGKVWSLVLWAHMDIGCELQGVPPFLALGRDAWFRPQ